MSIYICILYLSFRFWVFTASRKQICIERCVGSRNHGILVCVCGGGYTVFQQGFILVDMGLNEMDVAPCSMLAGSTARLRRCQAQSRAQDDIAIRARYLGNCCWFFRHDTPKSFLAAPYSSLKVSSEDSSLAGSPGALSVSTFRRICTILIVAKWET